MVKLFPHQDQVLKETEGKNKVAYYMDMGLGKTFVGGEKAVNLHENILVVCQKSKVNDWIEHFKTYYECCLYDLTNKKDFINFNCDMDVYKRFGSPVPMIAVINYDLIWRRKELSNLTDYTLILDESSLIQNDTTKRTKFILNKLHPSNIILLSGTPTSGKYEKLWSQMHLLGWNINKQLFLSQYCVWGKTHDGYPIIVGYKNEDRLKRKMREFGCIFMKTEEVIDLPMQNFIDVKVKETKEYRYFKKNRVITIGDKELIGDTTLTNLLYQRMLCGSYNQDKLDALKDLIDSTEDRLIIFYNFNDELEAIKLLCDDRPISVVNGSKKDLQAYNECSNSITLVQYQSGSMGLNLQLANKIIYFTPTLSSELFEQSKKRIHRIGQEQPCFYYLLKCGIENRIYDVLSMRKDYTDALFEKEELCDVTRQGN